jgi:hypothetical protein
MKYDLKKRIFLLKKFYEFKSICLVQRAFRTEYKNETTPSSSVIKNIVSNFEKTGSVGYTRPKCKEPSKKREEAKNQLKVMVSENTSLSSRKAASALGVSQYLILSILHDDMHVKPYKQQHFHKLEYHDYEKRVDFARWFLSLHQATKFSMICSDEAYFF